MNEITNTKEQIINEAKEIIKKYEEIQKEVAKYYFVERKSGLQNLREFIDIIEREGINCPKCGSKLEIIIMDYIYEGQIEITAKNYFDIEAHCDKCGLHRKALIRKADVVKANELLSNANEYDKVLIKFLLDDTTDLFETFMYNVEADEFVRWDDWWEATDTCTVIITSPTFTVTKYIEWNKVKHLFEKVANKFWNIKNVEEFKKIMKDVAKSKLRKEILEKIEEILKIKKERETLEKQMKELKDKIIELAKKLKEMKEKEEYEKLEWIKVYQGIDTGRWYCEIKEIEKMLNKKLDGLIFDGWIPDYWLPNPNAKYKVEDLINKGLAKIEKDERGREVLLIHKSAIEKMKNDEPL